MEVSGSNFNVFEAVRKQTNDMLNSMMNDSFLLDLTKSCKVLPLRECREVTPEAFHHLYKNMMEKSTKLRELDVYLSNEECTSFLKLIGIIFRGGKFFSNRSIEIYECLEIFDWGGSLARWIIFDGNIEISNYGFLLKLHESQESLEMAKNRAGLERIVIDRS